MRSSCRAGFARRRTCRRRTIGSAYEGNGRLAVCRRLGVRFWAFDLGRSVPEEERIRLMFHHHGTRRSLGREEIAERAAR